MFNSIIVIGIIVLIVILSWYLLHDVPAVKETIKTSREVVNKVNKAAKGPAPIRSANGPVLKVKEPGAHSYNTVELTKDVVRIGSSGRCDLVLKDDAVEKLHARIEKKMKGNTVYYEFINLSKRNPAEILNQESQEYEYLGNRRGVVLGDSEAFYVGNTKLIFKRPVRNHVPTRTDRMVISGEGVLSRADAEEKRSDSRDISIPAAAADISTARIDKHATLRADTDQNEETIPVSKHDIRRTRLMARGDTIEVR